MKIFLIGGTGLLGSEIARQLIEKGHSVSSISLPPLLEDGNIPKEMELKLGNYIDMSDDEIKECFKDCEAFIFAAGIDERVEGAPPIYDLYKKYNIDALERLMRIAKEMGVKHTVILGSYFSHFAKEWKHLELTKHHPYIRSRIDQEKLALSFAEDGKMDVAILELPYIFGAQKGRKPVWQFIAEMIRNAKGDKLMYPKGGTTMVTVKQVGQATLGALEKTKGGKCYPVGWFNMTWEEWLEKFSMYMGEPKKVKTIPTFLYKLGAKKMAKDIIASGKESGLEMNEYVKVMTSNAFIDKDIIKNELNVQDDDIDAAIKESAELCLDILDKKEEVVDMKAE